MNKSKYLKFTALLISFFSSPLFAEDIIIERLNDKLHFAIYPSDNKLNHYVLWFPTVQACSEIDDSQPLSLESDNIYKSPKSGGYLCVIRSEKMLDGEWVNYEVKPGNKLLSFKKKGVNPGHLPNIVYELPFERFDCSFTTAGKKIKLCKLQLEVKR